jgi:hypothetical protein
MFSAFATILSTQGILIYASQNEVANLYKLPLRIAGGTWACYFLVWWLASVVPAGTVEYQQFEASKSEEKKTN